MNSKNRLYIPEKIIGRINRFKKQRDKAGMPVMAVNNVRLPPQALQGLEHTNIEKNHLFNASFQITFIKDVRKETVALEIFFVVEKICLDLA